MQFYYNIDNQIVFLKEIFNLNSSSKVLDVGCYNGEHVKRLQETSENIYGIDITKPKEEFKNFIQGDIFSSKIPDNLDGVYILSPFFGENWNNYTQLFSILNPSLKNGAKIILDLYFLNDLEINYTYQDFKLLPEKVILNNYIRKEDHLICNRTFLFKDWTNRSLELKWKIFLQSELDILANENGFKIQNLYYDFDVSKTGSLEAQDRKKKRVVVFEKIKSIGY